MSAQVKYIEEIVRLPALTAEGKPCEILERITLSREIQQDGSLGEPTIVNRRFDLRTGERVNHIGEDEFELDETGDRLTVERR